MTTPTPETRPTLLFIPDISGFTRFVNETEISHSQHIIGELLEALIDAVELDLQVSEIEGDAILFYRHGPTPTAAELLAQVQRMYVAFHSHLKRYDTYRICHCGACCSAIDLTLKFVVHYGETAEKEVREHTKLFGRDVIVAHRLLKNSLVSDEYVLITAPLVRACSTWVHVEAAAWADVEHGDETYDFGPIEYCHIDLAPLRDRVPEPEPLTVGLQGDKMCVLDMETVVEASLSSVFNLLSDVTRRHEWVAYLQDSTEQNGRITREGSTHRCVMAGTDEDPFFISHSFEDTDDAITFVDSEPHLKMDVVYNLKRIGPRLTRMRRREFIRRGLFRKLKYELLRKKKMLAWVGVSWVQFKAILAEMEASGERPPASIVLPSLVGKGDGAASTGRIATARAAPSVGLVTPLAAPQRPVAPAPTDGPPAPPSDAPPPPAA